MTADLSISEEHAALQQRLLNIYTPLEEASEELHSVKRRAIRSKFNHADSPLRQDCAFAVHIGHVATPNFEIERFLCLASDSKLQPLFWEYHRDKFVSCNPCKRSLGRMGFHTGRNRHNQPLVAYRNVVCFSQNGRPIAEVRTFWGQPLVEFHHDLLLATWPHLTRNICWNASDWYHAHGPTPRHYYRELFALLLSHGMLFESFLLDKIEYQFTRDVVLPAFQEVRDRYGLKPLIVRLDPSESEGDPYWLLYPHEAQLCVEEKLGRTES